MLLSNIVSRQCSDDILDPTYYKRETPAPATSKIALIVILPVGRQRILIYVNFCRRVCNGLLQASDDCGDMKKEAVRPEPGKRGSGCTDTA
jgi:hypothetical protein